MKPERIELRQIRMRLRDPFETSFGIKDERHVVLVIVRADGITGYGEVTAAEGPFFSHESYETAWHVLSDFMIPWCLNQALEAPSDVGALTRRIRGHNMARAGLENALWDWTARAQGVPLWRLLGGTRTEVESGVSIGIQPSIDALFSRVDEALNAGYRRIKLKIKPGRDVSVMTGVRERWPNVPLMADANSAYTLDDIDVFRAIDDLGLTMVEQPLHHEDMVDHAQLQKALRTPICLDESIHSADDARKAISIGACRLVNVKLGRVGGHSGARAIHDACRDRGVPVWCGGMLETGIGRAHNIAMSSLENFSLPGDVSASRRYWSEDIVDPEIEVSSDGTIVQSSDPGIGYRIREDRIDSLTERSRTFVP